MYPPSYHLAAFVSLNNVMNLSNVLNKLLALNEITGEALLNAGLKKPYYSRNNGKGLILPLTNVAT